MRELILFALLKCNTREQETDLAEFNSDSRISSFPTLKLSPYRPGESLRAPGG